MHAIDELPFAFGWLEAEPAWMGRAAHAVAADGRVWVIDPFDDPAAEARVRALGEPAGVVQLLDRHDRDCAAWARRLGVPHHRLPREVPGAPFEVLPVPALPGWQEVALWFASSGTLVCADALAAAPGYAGGSRVAVHPFLRLRPPRALDELPVQHLLLGHGPGVHGPAARQAVEHALGTALTGLPGLAIGLAGVGLKGVVGRLR